jgi:NAD(P)-dependent dehydrogenase (short-subunit alcohol dehydrogenase family)
MDTLDGRIALITGGSPGIGAAAFRPVTETSRA